MSGGKGNCNFYISTLAYLSQLEQAKIENCRIAFGLYFLGSFFKKVNSIDEAIESFLLSTKMNPEFGEAFVKIGGLYLHKSKH